MSEEEYEATTTWKIPQRSCWTSAKESYTSCDETNVLDPLPNLGPSSAAQTTLPWIQVFHAYAWIQTPTPPTSVAMKRDPLHDVRSTPRVHLHTQPYFNLKYYSKPQNHTTRTIPQCNQRQFKGRQNLNTQWISTPTTRKPCPMFEDVEKNQQT